VQALQLPVTENHCFSISSLEGPGPGQDGGEWAALFGACYAGAGASSSSKVAA
jgi:hypothetical protein